MPRYIDAYNIKLKGISIFDQNLEILIPLSDVRKSLQMTPAADVVKVVRCKDCLYFEYKIGSYGTCEHWHTNSQDIFDLNFCGYAESRTSKKEIWRSKRWTEKDRLRK